MRLGVKGDVVRNGVGSVFASPKSSNGENLLRRHHSHISPARTTEPMTAPMTTPAMTLTSTERDLLLPDPGVGSPDGGTLIEIINDCVICE